MNRIRETYNGVKTKCFIREHTITLTQSKVIYKKTKKKVKDHCLNISLCQVRGVYS